MRDFDLARRACLLLALTLGGVTACSEAPVSPEDAPPEAPAAASGPSDASLDSPSPPPSQTDNSLDTPPPPPPAQPGAQSDATLDESAASAEPVAENLPDIEAKTHNLTVVRQSRSGRVYLLSETAASDLQPGKLILLKQDSDPIMAFRLLKIYPDQKQLAAKKLRTYGNYASLDNGSAFLGVEKISDYIPPPPTPTPQDRSDLKELEAANTPSQKAAGSDSQLDSGSTGAEKSSEPAPEPETPDEDANPNQDVYVEEFRVIDPYSNWVTGEFGFFRANAPDGTSKYLVGGGARYAYSLGKMIFVHKNTLQDSLSPEIGVFYYKVLNFVTPSDAYNVMPVLATLRYNLVFDEDMTLFGYLGISQSFVLSATAPTKEALASLNATQAAVGIGAFFRIGPNWYTRVDLGLDIVGLGLVLRF